MRKCMIAGNWKMNLSPDQTGVMLKELVASFKNQNSAEIVVAPPYVSIYKAQELLKGTEIKVSAQNVYHQENGAFTGEISASMLSDMHVPYVIIGHSERRHVFGELNEGINLKLHACFRNKLIPIFCVGEKLDEREAGITEKVVNLQVEKGLDGISAEQAEKLVIAYEPVWAIGTGKNASSSDAQEICGLIRKILTRLYSSDTAAKTRILYGGSVKPENISEYMNCPDVDGALVGGASLKADSFLKIINY